MAGLYGDYTANYVVQGRVPIVTTSWKPLIATEGGSSPLAGRRQIRIQLKSNVGGAMAIAYTTKNADGTFTAPTKVVKECTVMAGNTTWVEPIGDAIQVWGRLSNKSGSTATSIIAVITEYR